MFCAPDGDQGQLSGTSGARQSPDAKFQAKVSASLQDYRLACQTSLHCAA